jgi:histidinol phosphatase-like PHP family hydrolase
MKLKNDLSYGDYHIHSCTLSDGLNSIDEIVFQAGELHLKEIAITDHCQHYLDRYYIEKKTHYDIIASGRWKNIVNDVNIIFGVEADLLNENGDICDSIQSITPEFIILSTHKLVYEGDTNDIKKGYLNAIRRFSTRINILGHLCTKQFSDYLDADDIIEIVHAANSANISLELDCANLINNKTCEANLKAMLSSCETLYVNSDAHTLYELSSARGEGFNYLSSHRFL